MPSPAPSGTASHVTRACGHLAHFPIFSLHMCVLAALCNFTCHLTSPHNRTQDRGLPVTTRTLALQLCASHLGRRQLCPHPTLTEEQEHTATAQRRRPAQPSASFQSSRQDKAAVNTRVLPFLWT